MASDYEIKQRLRLTDDVYEEGEDLPPGRIANKGDIVEVVSNVPRTWDLSVRHPGAKGAFGVNETEVEEADDGE